MESKEEEAWTEERHYLYISWLERNFIEKLCRQQWLEIGAGDRDGVKEIHDDESDCSSHHEVDLSLPDGATEAPAQSTEPMDIDFEGGLSSEATS